MICLPSTSRQVEKKLVPKGLHCWRRTIGNPVSAAILVFSRRRTLQGWLPTRCKRRAIRNDSEDISVPATLFEISITMGRWRPPAAKSSPYITPGGFQVLQQELRSLWERRQDVVRHVAAAAAEGDRSENAEYIYRKKELREIDRRIGYLQKRLPALKVVAEPPSDVERVFFGAVVELETEDGHLHRFRIVGADETDAESGSISVDSPMARALLKKQIDEEVVVQTGVSRQRYIIVRVEYE